MDGQKRTYGFHADSPLKIQATEAEVEVYNTYFDTIVNRGEAINDGDEGFATYLDVHNRVIEAWKMLGMPPWDNDNTRLILVK